MIREFFIGPAYPSSYTAYMVHPRLEEQRGRVARTHSCNYRADRILHLVNRLSGRNWLRGRAGDWSQSAGTEGNT